VVNLPEGTGSLAIVMHHYLFPGDTSRVSSYLLLWGIPPSVSDVPHGGAATGDWYFAGRAELSTVGAGAPH
jgi:hypothetical protein